MTSYPAIVSDFLPLLHLIVFVPFDLSLVFQLLVLFSFSYLLFIACLMNSSSICFWTWNTRKNNNKKVKQIFLLLLLQFCQLTMHENDELLGNVKDASGRPTRAIFFTFFNWILHFCAELILVKFFEFLSWFWDDDAWSGHCLDWTFFWKFWNLPCVIICETV